MVKHVCTFLGLNDTLDIASDGLEWVTRTVVRFSAVSEEVGFGVN